MTFATTSELLPHQADAVAKLLPSRVGGLFAEMGTGKSRILIELARLRAARGKIDRVVWFCPVAIKDTIKGEILRHTDCGEDAVVVFDDKTRAAALPQDRFWYVVGIESMASSLRVVAAVNALITETTFVAVDESTYIKGHRAKRTLRITHMGGRARYRAVLTGTPFTQGAVDLFAQMTFLSPKILGYNSFYSFAANHLVYDVDRVTGKTTGRIVRTLNDEYLAAKIAPYVYQIKKDECLTLPEKLYERHTVPMTREQRDAYDDAKKMCAEDARTYDSPHIALFRLFSLLQGIVCGAYHGQPLHHRRLDGLLDVLLRVPADEKVVIWAKYRFAVREIVTALRLAYGEGAVHEFHGGLDERRRNEELTAWRAGGRFLVATQAAGGHGLTLTEASTAIFYANSFKFSERAQAEDRIHRIGQERPCTYIDLAVAPGIDDRILSALDSKGDGLESFRRQIERFRRDGLKTRIREAILAL